MDSPILRDVWATDYSNNNFEIKLMKLENMIDWDLTILIQLYDNL